MKIGLIREGKNPPDKRVPLTPMQCVELMSHYNNVEVVVQSSPIRAYTDEEYSNVGIRVVDSVEDCDVLMGVKEVPIDQLLPQKTYFFFSHTLKKQPYNRNLLRAILDKKIRLIDYEALKDVNGNRLIAFGRWAGIVGAYNGLRGYGEMTGLYSLKPAHECHDREEMNAQLAHLKLPKGFRIALTGTGRVGQGAIETLNVAKIRRVSPEEYLISTDTDPLYTILETTDYYRKKDHSPATRSEFYADPSAFESTFLHYAAGTDLYMACHFWGGGAPYIFTRQDARHPDFNVKYVADISCDIDGPVASTLQPSTIEHPFYGYDPISESVVEHGKPGSIGVMAIDNLPCELPRDASEAFGKQFLDRVAPFFFGVDKDRVIERATEAADGQLTPEFAYLSDYVK